MGEYLSFEEIEQILEREAIIDLDLERDLEFVYDYTYEKEGEEGLERLGKWITDACNKVIGELLSEMESRGLKIDRKDYKRVFKYVVVDVFKDLVDGRELKGPWIVYADTMGYIYADGKWEVFEGSDEPTNRDLEFYRKLVEGGDKVVTVYGVHGEDFVREWEKSGIPEGVYFSNKEWVAMRYWHKEGGDVLVRVRLKGKYLVSTSDIEFMTVERVPVGEFEVRIIKYV